MKKSLFLAAAIVAAMTAGAQTYIGQPVPDWNGFIPGVFTTSGTPCLIYERTTDMRESNVSYYGYRRDYRLDTVCIYDKDLRREKTFSPNLGTYQYVHKEESRYNDGSWNTGSDDSYIAQVWPIDIEFLNLDETGRYSDGTYTQVLFNNDNRYEFLVPSYSNATYTRLDSSLYRDSYWNETTQTIEYRTEWHYYRYTYPAISAFNIVADNGSVVGTINAPIGKIFAFDGDANLFKFGGKYYLILETSDGQEAWYRIDGATQSVSLVEDAPIAVFPTVVNRGSNVTIDLGDNPQGRQVEVIDATGRIVKRVAVPAGQREVQVGTADLGRGLNLISTPRQGAAKIIVR